MPQRADDGKRGKEAGKRAVVGIAQVLLVGRHDEGRGKCRKECNAEHGIFPHEGQDGVKNAVSMYRRM